MSDNSKSLKPLIAKILRRAVGKPDSTIFSFDGEEFALGDIVNEVVSVAEYLTTLEIRQDFIVLSLENSPRFAVAFLAGNMCNLNVGVFNDLWPSAMVSKTLEYLQPDCVLFDTKAPNTNCLTVDMASIDRREYITIDFSKSAEKLEAEHNVERAFYTGFTSGSSGVPKGFVRNELSWVLSFESDKREFGFSDKDVFICTGSFAHSLFLYALLRALYTGSQLLAYKSFRPDKIVPDIEAMSGTVLFVVPTQLLALCEFAVKKKLKCTSPRLVLSAGAKLHKRIRKLAQEVYPNAEVVEFYGSSEHGYISISRQSESPPEESVGRVFDSVQISIRDSEGRDVKAGQIGQVFVESPYQFSGYAQTSESSQLALPELDGFTGTGDTGYLDDNGFLYLSGRTDRMIVSSAHNIYPESIESVLLSIKGIRRAAVLSRACEHRGQRLIAIVEFQDGYRFSRKELLTITRKALPVFAVPSVYLECDDWPLTVSYKNDYQRLKKQAVAGLMEITT